VTSLTSRLAPSRPMRSSSSASSSSIGLGGGSGDRLRRARLLRLGEGPQEHPPERLDGLELRLGGVEVDGRHREGEVDGPLVVGARMTGPPGRVGGEQHLEHRRRPLDGTGLLLHHARGAQLRRGGAGEPRLELGPEGGEQLPELVVALATVGDEEPAGQVERLQRGVVAEAIGADAVDAVADLRQGGADGADEPVDRLDERSRHRTRLGTWGLRHIGQSDGPFGRCSSSTTSKPWRPYNGMFCSFDDSR
jgi:hypothetical protein